MSDLAHIARLEKPLAVHDVVQVHPNVPEVGGEFGIVAEVKPPLVVCLFSTGDVHQILVKPVPLQMVEHIGKAKWWPQQSSLVLRPTMAPST